MAKRALIVDDSRSARVILSRMLEGYGLKVETSESAEQALTFLEHDHPDVIFMDHLMPGMDGFQAVQAIKSNPATSAIPVIMYTSQEGELYVSQARALGAVGVLPKTVKQSDVSRVLYQLRLLPDRRDGREPTLVPIELADLTPRSEVPPPRPAPTPTGNIELENTLRQVVAPLLKEQQNELRRWLTAAFDSLGVTASDARQNVTIEGQEAPPPAAPTHLQVPRAWAWPLGLGVALSFIALVVLALMQVRSEDELGKARALNSQLASRLEAQGRQMATALARPAEPPPEPPMAAQSTSPEISLRAGAIPEPVPYGEAPLSGPRLDRLRQILGQLRQQGVAGTVRATTYIGDFCLAGNAVEGYALAADDLQARKCDVIGNPYEDGLRSAQRESLAFANLVSTTRTETQGRLNVEVVFAGRKPLLPYPGVPPAEKVSAGEWNRVAERNNRVEFAFQPHAEAAAQTSSMP